MHTFFINTSKRQFESYRQILDIYRDTQKLISIDCPIDKWQNKADGYESCVHKMGEYIDNYDDINNDYNLVIYVDLNAFEAYTSIPLDEHRDRYACLEAMYSFFSRYIKDTLMKKLSDLVRDPQETVIVFEEDEKPQDGDVVTDQGKRELRDQMKRLLRLSDDEILEDRVKAYFENDERDGAVGFIERIRPRKELLEGQLKSYIEDIEIFLEEAKKYVPNEPINTPLEEMLMRMYGRRNHDTQNMKLVSFVTNPRANVTNKSECAKRDLQLYFYLLECIEKESVYVGDNARPFPQMNKAKWEEVINAFKQKWSEFRNQLREIDNLSENFTEKGLVPKLHELDFKRFGLNENGDRDVEYGSYDENSTDAGKSGNTAQSNDPADRNDGKSITDSTQRKLISGMPYRDKILDEYPESVHLKKDDGESNKESEKKGNNCEKRPEKRKTREKNKENTIMRPKMRDNNEEKYSKDIENKVKWHDAFHSELGRHIADVLVRYAGSSGNNAKPRLKKRNVLVLEDGLNEDRAYMYGVKDINESDGYKKAQDPDRAEDLSNSAYQFAKEDYWGSGAKQISSLTNINDMANWALTAVRDITTSLHKLKTVAIGMFFGIAFLYLPFIILGWDAITRNLLTVSVAMSSIAIPVVLMYGVLLAMTALQHRRYKQVLKEFEGKVEKAMGQSESAAEAYDQFLSVYIPSLRWIYEYKMDVDFYLACCKMANARLDHHKEMLNARITAVWNMVQNLEGRNAQYPVPGPIDAMDKIDFTEAYCTGDKNPKFYTIVDRDLLNIIGQGGE